jgi:lipopolysaccharide export LptBFGC system permease protein LptF
VNGTRKVADQRVAFWRSRVRFWRYVAIPVSVLAVVFNAVVAGMLARTNNPWLVVAGVLLVVAGGYPVVLAVNGLRFAQGVLREHVTPSNHSPVPSPKEPSV